MTILVIPGRAKGANPESSYIDDLCIFWIPDRRFAASRMTEITRW
jgi:hypothetical protein